MLGIGKMFRPDPMTAMALLISVESGGLTPIRPQCFTSTPFSISCFVEGLCTHFIIVNHTYIVN
jgi:hypothetical protein